MGGLDGPHMTVCELTVPFSGRFERRASQGSRQSPTPRPGARPGRGAGSCAARRRGSSLIEKTQWRSVPRPHPRREKAQNEGAPRELADLHGEPIMGIVLHSSTRPTSSTTTGHHQFESGRKSIYGRPDTEEGVAFLPINWAMRRAIGLSTFSHILRIAKTPRASVTIPPPT
jgi:hypothetical protein